MNRRIVVRRVTLGALAAGLVPLAAAGGAGAASDNSPALCRSSFGDRGPSSGPIVGEAPSGDPMVVSVGWDPGDWTEGLGRIVTCVGVDGHAAEWMTNTVVSPPNTGSLTLNLALPDGRPGALVCEQSLLVGDKGAAGRTRTTSPVCFKLRAPEPASPPAGRPGHRPADGAGQPGPASATTPAIRPTPTVHAPTPPAPAPTPNPASTPPARGAFEARRPAASRGTGPMADELARSAAGIAATPVASAAAAPVTAPWAPMARRAALAATPRTSAAGTAGGPAAAGAPVAALPRTGLGNKIPLAGAGGLLALGGVSIMFGSPRRRRTT